MAADDAWTDFGRALVDAIKDAPARIEGIMGHVAARTLDGTRDDHLETTQSLLDFAGVTIDELKPITVFAALNETLRDAAEAATLLGQDDPSEWMVRTIFESNIKQESLARAVAQAYAIGVMVGQNRPLTVEGETRVRPASGRGQQTRTQRPSRAARRASARVSERDRRRAR